VTAGLRPATAADYAPAAALLERLGLPLAGVPPDLGGFVVAEHDGRIVGTAAVEHYAAAGLLRSVAVDPAHRSAGLGAALVDSVLDRARAAGIDDVFLLTTTAERYFLRHGFAVASRDEVPAALQASAEFRGACPASAVLMRRRLERPRRVLVICTGNSARSQIAEALLTTRGRGRVEAASAGARPAPRVHPLALAVLREHGIEWPERAPQGIEAVAEREWDYVITVCDHAREACPILPGQPVALHWGMSDPARAEGSESERREAFRETYELLDSLIARFLAETAATSPPATTRPAGASAR
jgi:protein-tyrosine-phosphatase/N-acetylglutamate synthase-like GNAT family acetyltransferase